METNDLTEFFFQKNWSIFDTSWSTITKERICFWLLFIAETCAFLSIEKYHFECLICNRELLKETKKFNRYYQKEEKITTSKLDINVKLSINWEDSNLGKIYEQVKNK